MTLNVSISSVEWCFLHDMGEKSTLVDFFSIECRKGCFFCFPRLGRRSWLFNLAELVSAYCPEKPGAQIFCLARQTNLKTINLYLELDLLVKSVLKSLFYAKF